MGVGLKLCTYYQLFKEANFQTREVVLFVLYISANSFLVSLCSYQVRWEVLYSVPIQ